MDCVPRCDNRVGDPRERNLQLVDCGFGHAVSGRMKFGVKFGGGGVLNHVHHSPAASNERCRGAVKFSKGLERECVCQCECKGGLKGSSAATVRTVSSGIRRRRGPRGVCCRGRTEMRGP